jgi:hypothetical protein
VSPDTDRVAVATNGRGPHPETDPDPTAPEVEERPGLGTSTAPFSPTQLAVGFGILAAIVAILVRRLRRPSRGGPGGPLDRG